jgi:hypothetical protein
VSRSIATLRTSVAVRVLVERKNVYGQRAVSVGLNSRSRFRVVILLGCCGASGYLSRSDDDDDDDDCLLSPVVVVVVGMRGAAVGLSRAERWRRFEERVATLARRPACRIFSLFYIYGRCIRTALVKALRSWRDITSRP